MTDGGTAGRAVEAEQAELQRVGIVHRQAVAHRRCGGAVEQGGLRGTIDRSFQPAPAGVNGSLVPRFPSS